jgi:putative membrane protein (TIGR04086 family)
MQKPRQSKSKPVQNRSFLANILFGGLFSLLLALFLLMPISAFTSTGKIPESMMGLAVILCVFISSILGSRIAIRRAAEKKFLIGICQGVLLFLVVFAVGRAVSAEAALSKTTFGILIAALSGGALGGYTTSKRRKVSRVR